MALDTRPWFVRADARQLLRECAANPPQAVLIERKFIRSVDAYATFSLDDPRVAALDDIRRLHLDALFEAQVESVLIKAAGGLVTVDKAIDAALPSPVAGNGGDPAYVASLPDLDLHSGGATA